MVIFIGGLIGVGKTSLAKALAKKLNIYYYDVDSVKKEIYPTDPDYEYNLKNHIPFSDETRTKTFHKVVENFYKLAKKHQHIIVDETLHRKILRQILFDGAKKTFGRYMIIWIKANEETIEDRLTKNQREGHILKDPFAMYLVFKNQFEDFENADIFFENSAPLAESVEKLARLVKEKL